MYKRQTKNNYIRQKKKCETKRKIGKAESFNIKRTFSSFETNVEEVSLKKLIAHTKVEVSKSTMMRHLRRTGIVAEKAQAAIFLSENHKYGLSQMVEKESKFKSDHFH